MRRTSLIVKEEIKGIYQIIEILDGLAIEIATKNAKEEEVIPKESIRVLAAETSQAEKEVMTSPFKLHSLLKKDASESFDLHLTLPGLIIRLKLQMQLLRIEVRVRLRCE
ncbi:hypothetical protein M3638_07235 [Oceanobacillus profundus]|uniref:hypothetical protein n=1 Tax=Oceanobacillus profundus TaxID=372463 RepID=UPI002041A21F|nr:hypothetical protein [Oceanobacillus profundus]MCM3397636.1 hypothetical protein [Oceanobacillus profundus]